LADTQFVRKFVRILESLRETVDVLDSITIPNDGSPLDEKVDLAIARCRALVLV
jgi:hypothetical protein